MMVSISLLTEVRHFRLATKGLVPTFLVLSYITFSLPVLCQTVPGEPPAANNANSEQTAPQSSANPEQRSDKTHPLFLWKGTRNDQTVYLLGTIHVAKPNFYPLPQEIETASNESKVLFVEADILQADKLKILETLKQQGAYKPPETLSKNLSPQARAVLNEYLNWSGESIGIYDAWKPWVVAEILTSGALRRAGFKSDLGIDMHLLKEAHATKKKIVALESVESQLKMMESFDKSAQEKMLAADVLTMKDLSNELNKIADAWRKGDAYEMAKIIDSATGASSDMNAARNKLLDARNRLMVETLEKSLPPSGVAMVAVGAAHLPGANGLIVLLRQKGFEVNQVYGDQALSNNQAISFGGKNLEKLYYPEGHFRVKLPGEPEMHYSTLNGIRSVDYSYPEFAGNFQVSYLILPGIITTASAQQKFMNIITNVFVEKTKAKLLSSTPFSNAYGAGTLVDCKLPIKAKTTNEDILMRLRFQLSGRMLYLVGGQGTAPWIHSKRLADVMNSLEIIPETSASGNSTTRSASSTANSYGQTARSGPLGGYSSPSSSYSFRSNYGVQPTSYGSNSTNSWGGDQRNRMQEVQRKMRQDMEHSHAQWGSN
ncbi:MAG: hypothetical protein C5B53_10240 [Candidatus Melainabacteria bacterium]|nr:MAG: hypothetical protein C5B53_10240 [Candidatus Melainabacteria bacterium]